MEEEEDKDYKTYKSAIISKIARLHHIDTQTSYISDKDEFRLFNKMAAIKCKLADLDLRLEMLKWKLMTEEEKRGVKTALIAFMRMHNNIREKPKRTQSPKKYTVTYKNQKINKSYYR